MRNVFAVVIVINVLWGACLNSQAQNITRGPYLQHGTPASMVVRWRTDIRAGSIVYYGTDPKALASKASSRKKSTEHVVQLRGLTPGTRYYYAVGTARNKTLAGGTSDYFFITAPPSGTAKPIRVWVIGDPGTRTTNQVAVRDAYYNFTGNRHTDAWLMLGDNAYADGTDQEYQGAIFDMYGDMLRKSVVWPTLGNHDWHSAKSATQSGVYFDIFTLPKSGEAGGVPSGTEAYYSFDYGNAHFICLNSCDSERSVDAPMLTWLKKDLAANKRDWAFAYWHHPPYTKGSHDSDAYILTRRPGDWAGSDTGLKDMRENVLPILEAGGVDLVMCGHSHAYERSFLLDGHYDKSNTFGDRFKKNGGDGRVDGDGAYTKPGSGPGAHEGAVYVVAGSAGQISGGKLNHPAMFTSLNELGSLVLDINSNRLDVTFLNHKGVKRDHFTIVKGETKTSGEPSK